MASSKALPLRVGEVLERGQVLPALPLALSAQRQFDARRQQALCRYYLAAGAGGLAVGVHTTQFEIRLPGNRGHSEFSLGILNVSGFGRFRFLA
jgi:hypothetical protein